MSANKSNRRADPAWKPRSEMKLINTAMRRVDGPDKVTGRAMYSADMRLPNMVYARLVLLQVPRAVVEKIDVSRALEVEGCVLAQPYVEAGTEVLYSGDDSVVAYVAAETEEAAEDAARAVRLTLMPGPVLVTRLQSLAPGAAEVTSDGNVGRLREQGDEEDAVLGLSESDVLIEETYELPIQHHLCLETHGCVVDYDGEQATVYASTQAVTSNQGEFAQLLDLPSDKVRIVTEHMGGGFGAKFGAGVEGGIACTIAKQLKRPVHLLLDRPQEFQMGGNRSGTHARVKAGATADGTLRVIQAEVDRLGGVGGGSFPGLPYIYEAEARHVKDRSVHTASDSSRAMRAPGHPQASFIMESVMDELAYGLAMDPLEFRKRNLGDDVWHRHLDTVAQEIGWAAHPNKTAAGAPDDDGMAEGIGFAVATWGAGGRRGAECEVRLNPDGSVTSSCAVQDLGTGARTYVAAIPAEEFGLPLDAVTARIGDSSLPPGVGSGGSVTTGSVAPAVKAAAHGAREAMEKRLAEAIPGDVDGFVWADGRVRSTGGADFDVSFREACAMLGTQPVAVTAGHDRSLQARGQLHGAQAVRVRVDTWTGRVQVVKMVAIQDQGLPMNRMALESQIKGGMIQALSYGLLEERVFDNEHGWLLTDNMETYRVAGTKEIPELVAIIDDEDDRPVTGMAEAPVIPGQSALSNAIYNACGARLRAVPFTPDRVLAALGLLS